MPTNALPCGRAMWRERVSRDGYSPLTADQWALVLDGVPLSDEQEARILTVAEIDDDWVRLARMREIQLEIAAEAAHR